MRAMALTLLALLPLGCTTTDMPPAEPRIPPAPRAVTVAVPEDLPRQQERVCAAAIAEHLRKPLSVVHPRWLSESGGIALIETRDGNRRHLCEVDASGRLIGYSHPRG